jgi:hypothetical protein
MTKQTPISKTTKNQGFFSTKIIKEAKLEAWKHN